MSNSSITVWHNAEMAHRLFLQRGSNCERIHGHSWRIELELFGVVDQQGLLGGIDFGTLKRLFRDHLDKNYDHRLLLNQADPLADLIIPNLGQLPGLYAFNGDPTTENVARQISHWAALEFSGFPNKIVVHESPTNTATYRHLNVA